MRTNMRTNMRTIRSFLLLATLCAGVLTACGGGGSSTGSSSTNGSGGSTTPVTTVPAAGTITTAAGIQAIFLGNNGPASGVTLGPPSGAVADAAGNIYFADTGNSVVHKISSNGTISIVAGTGFSGYGGDNGPATSALLSEPAAVAVDAQGNLYIADTSNNNVRKVDVHGIITTFAGVYTSYPRAPASGDNGPATSAMLCSPQGISADAGGNVYIADTCDLRGGGIRKVNTAGIITTVAGNGTYGSGSSGDNGPAVDAQLLQPTGVTTDAAGNIYFAEFGNNRIRKVAASTGIITTVAGNGTQGYSGDNGPATSASLALPASVAVDQNGNLYIADSLNNRIRKVDGNGVITSVAGNGVAGYAGDNGPASSAQLSLPRGVSLDAKGNLLIADYGNFVIRQVATSGVITTIAGGKVPTMGNNGPATSALFSQPSGIAVDSSGNLYVADSYNQVVRKKDAVTGIITIVAGGGTGNPGDGGPATGATLGMPSAVAFDAAGNLYIADVSNGKIRKVTTATGIITTVAGNGAVVSVPSENGPSNACVYAGDNVAATGTTLCSPTGIAIDKAGNIYVAEATYGRIRKIAAATGLVTTVAGTGTLGYGGDNGPATSAMIQASGIAVDASGNLLLADTGNNALRKVDGASGIITTMAGNGTQGYAGDGGPATGAVLGQPSGIALDAGGNIYFAESVNGRVRKIAAATGIISTVAGSATRGNSGDNGAATSAQLFDPVGVAFDSKGNLYIVDGMVGVVREAWGIGAAN